MPRPPCTPSNEHAKALAAAQDIEGAPSGATKTGGRERAASESEPQREVGGKSAFPPGDDRLSPPQPRRPVSSGYVRSVRRQGEGQSSTVVDRTATVWLTISTEWRSHQAITSIQRWSVAPMGRSRSRKNTLAHTLATDSWQTRATVDSNAKPRLPRRAALGQLARWWLKQPSGRPHWQKREGQWERKVKATQWEDPRTVDARNLWSGVEGQSGEREAERGPPSEREQGPLGRRDAKCCSRTNEASCHPSSGIANTPRTKAASARSRAVGKSSHSGVYQPHARKSAQHDAAALKCRMSVGPDKHLTVVSVTTG